MPRFEIRIPVCILSALSVLFAHAHAQQDGGAIRYKTNAEIAMSRATADDRGLLNGGSEDRTGPALWRASLGRAHVYLFGTIHLNPESVEWRTEAFEAAMAASDTTYFETPTRGPQAEAVIARLVALHGAAVGKPLDEKLGPSRWSRFGRLAGAYGLNAEAFRGSEPWLAIVALTTSALAASGFDSENAVDDFVASIAERERDKIAYLETPETHIAALASLDDDGFAVFDDTLTETPRIKSEMDKMIESWGKGDISALEEVVLDPLRQTPRAYHAMFTARNQAWTAHIKRLLEEDADSFVAAGAGHMIGENGLVSLLRREGVRVDRIQ